MRYAIFVLIMGCGHTTDTQRSAEADDAGAAGGTASVFIEPSSQAGKSGSAVPDAGAADSKGGEANTTSGPFSVPGSPPLELNGSSATLTLTQPPDSGCRDSGDLSLNLPASCAVKADTFYAVMWQAETDISSETGFAITGNPTHAEVRMRVRSLSLSQSDCNVSNYVRLSENSFSADFECLKLQEDAVPNFCAAKGSVKFVNCWTP